MPLREEGDARQQATEDAALIRKQLERLVLLERQAGRRDIKAHDAIAAHKRLERRMQEAERALREIVAVDAGESYYHQGWVPFHRCQDIARAYFGVGGDVQEQKLRDTFGPKELAAKRKCSECFGKGFEGQDDQPGLLLPAYECSKCHGSGTQEDD